MLKTLLLSTAFVCAAGAHAHAGVTVHCDITDMHNNVLHWDLEVFNHGDSASQVDFTKNGIRPAGASATDLWNVFYDNAVNVVQLTYARDPSYQIRYFSKYGANPGQATMFHGANAIGNGRCYVDQSSAPAPQQSAPNHDWDSPTEAQDDSIPLQIVGHAQYVMVALGSHNARMLFDTGATDGTLQKTHADWMIANGEADEGPQAAFTDAQGAEHETRTIIIHTLQLGAHVLHDVHLGVVPDEADALLGIAVLDRIGPFKLDRSNHTLTFMASGS